MERDFNEGMYRSMSYPPGMIDNILHDKNHKDHIIRQNTIRLAEEMLESGCVEINDEEDRYSPYGIGARILSMRVKVYKPDR